MKPNYRFRNNGINYTFDFSYPTISNLAPEPLHRNHWQVFGAGCTAWKAKSLSADAQQERANRRYIRDLFKARDQVYSNRLENQI